MITSHKNPGPEPVIAIDGQLGALLASVWYQGALRSRVQVSPLEIRRNHGHGLELFRDSGGTWALIAVNHPWTQPLTRTITITPPAEGPRMTERQDVRAHPTDGRIAQRFTLPDDLFERSGEKWLCLTVPTDAHQGPTQPILHVLTDDDVADWHPVTVPGGE